jgi:hypothetical protein
MWRYVLLGVLSIGLVTVAGCGRPGPNPVAVSLPAAAPAVNKEHGHKPAAHGGLIVEIGADNYHAEAVYEKGGALRLYTLGKDESRVQEVEVQTLRAFVRRAGETESTSFTLKPEPQAEDSAGKTSLFVGVLPEGYQWPRVEITVPSITIAGERLRFTISPEQGGHDEDMPTKVADDDERQLYLTPGGKYTLSDIAANGRQTASQAFRGQQSSHNDKPQPGDKICPISSTKSSEKFVWVVGGEKYEFCCPPCVDEFIKLAKEQPEKIKPPEEYIKK